MVAAVVPVKDFASAKQRLDAALPPAVRRRLAEVMLEDVLAEVMSSPCLDCVFVVTRDERAAAMATEKGASVIVDPDNQGQTQAVALATGALMQRGIHSMLVLPADIPLIMREDVQQIVRAAREADVVLVPAHDERGTNAVLLTPPDILPLRFGNDSFHPHRQSACDRGLRTSVLDLPRIALDIDTPADLISLATWPLRTRTQALLKEVAWDARSR